MKGLTEGVQTLVFCLWYSSVWEKGGHSFIVAAFSLKEYALPEFELRPTGFFDKFEEFVDRTGRLSRSRDVEISGNPEFAKHFAVRGVDEQAVRSLFQGPVLAAFAARPQSTWERFTSAVAGRGNWLIVYLPWSNPGLGSAEETFKFLEDARGIVAIFMKALQTGQGLQIRAGSSSGGPVSPGLSKA